MKSIYDVWSFAQMIGLALDFPLYISIQETNEQGLLREERSGWVTRSRGSIIENQATKIFSTNLIQKEIKTSDIVFGANGGIRKDNLVISCNSVFSEGLNYILERALLWFAEEDLRFHHYGRSYTNIEDMEEAIDLDESYFCTRGIYPPSMETTCFIPGPQGKFFKEHYYDSQKRTQDMHLSFSNIFPYDFAEALCNNIKAEELRIKFVKGKNFHNEESAYVVIPTIYTKLRLSLLIDPVWRDPHLL